MHAGFQKQMWATGGVGDNWFQRNKDSLGNRDLAGPAVRALKKKPESILEIGSANGWRLKAMRDEYGCQVTGVEPAQEPRFAAIDAGIQTFNTTADNLSAMDDESFDVVIYGFCLCFVSPEDWIPMVAEANRVLRDGGHIVVYDFVGTRFLKRRMMGIMKDDALEAKPIYIYNFDWTELWLAHPAYRRVYESFDLHHAEVCTMIHKDMSFLIRDHVQEKA
jgi:SAM-dependent methyltransferase